MQKYNIMLQQLSGESRYALNFKSNLAICLKRHVYNYAMLYGAETSWTLTKQEQNKLWLHRPTLKDVCSTSHYSAM